MRCLLRNLQVSLCTGLQHTYEQDAELWALQWREQRQLATFAGKHATIKFTPHAVDWESNPTTARVSMKSHQMDTSSMPS